MGMKIPEMCFLARLDGLQNGDTKMSLCMDDMRS